MDHLPPPTTRTPLRGVALIYDPRLNKGTAFTQQERDTLGLQGLLPPRVLTIEEQLGRVRHNYDAKPTDIEKYIFLVGLQDRNETLFYRLVTDNLVEMMPVLYTPTVGEACRTFGHIFRRPRGLYLSLRDRGSVAGVVANWPDRDVKVIVVTDGERILGLGDLGAHGMGIPIGKLSLYTACAGVAPGRCLPVMLDVGTDNAALREDPLYTGLRRPRERGHAYDDLVEEFVAAIEQHYPNALLQWEDFATANAMRLLERYRDRVCSFNDDIQGTAAVVLAALLGACRASAVPITQQRLLFVGAGSAAIGVAGLVVAAMKAEGLSEAEARSRVSMFDAGGLIVAARKDLPEHQRPYAHQHEPVDDLQQAVDTLKPTALIGLSTQGGLFTERIVTTMASLNPRPIVFALSNPTSRAECSAEQAYAWSEGRVLFASGSPFPPVRAKGKAIRPAQANNAYIFPGLGLGVVLSGARRVTNTMFYEAARAVAEAVSPASLARGELLSPLEGIRELSADIAARVARLAVKEGVARNDVPQDAGAWVRERMYQPVYPTYVPA